MNRYHSIFLLLIVWSLAALAQPEPNECWLAVRVMADDGQLFPAVPAVTLYRIDGKTRTYEGRTLSSQVGAVTMIELTPGDHEIRLTLPAYGLLDNPRLLKLLSGPNTLEWRVPAVIPVQGTLIQPTGLPAPRKIQAFLLNAGTSRPLPSDSTMKDGVYHLPGVFPGPYRLFVQTETGYGVITLTAPGDATRPLDAPMTLTPGSTITFELSQQLDSGNTAPLPNATLTLTGSVEKGFVPAITLRTDGLGCAVSLSLPPGKWKWTAYAQNLQAASGICLLANTPQTIPAILSPPKK